MKGKKEFLTRSVWRKYSKDMLCKEIWDHEPSHEIFNLLKNYMEDEVVEFFTSVSERRKVNKTD